MARFVVIDHSICGLAGHHYEYAMHVLRAAARAGYQPVLATNRRFSENPGSSWTVLPLYEFGFWPEFAAPRWAKLLRKSANLSRDAWFRGRCRLRHSLLGLAWRERARWRRLPGQPATVVQGVKLLRVACLVALLPVGILGLAARGCSKLYPGTRRVLGRVPMPSSIRLILTSLVSLPARAIGGLPGAWQGWRRQRQERRQAEAFSRDTSLLVAKLEPRSDDVFFIPTIAPRDMLGLLDVLASAPAATEPSWHLLFRRNIYRGTEADYDAQEDSLAQTRAVFQQLQHQSGTTKARVFSYTDTDELTKQYNRLRAFPFHTLPIPHTYAPDDRTRHEGPVRLTYLGDARNEKGFPLLPSLAADLMSDYLATGRASLVVQCNYNIPGGEAASSVARGQLESLPPRVVSLYKEPLSSEQYRSLLLDSGIILLPYHAPNYYARSSGILVESLAAGIPVIVPARSWLARQFLDAYCGYQETLRSRMALLSTYEVSFSEPGSHCWVRTPRGATHLLLQAEPESGIAEFPVRVAQFEEPVSCVEGVSNAILERGSTWLLPLRPSIARLRITTEASGLLRLDFLRQCPEHPAPTGAVGQIYHEETEIPDLLREMIDHYEHYHRTALEFAEPWGRYHNADRLVGELSGRVACEPGPDSAAGYSGRRPALSIHP